MSISKKKISYFIFIVGITLLSYFIMIGIGNDGRTETLRIYGILCFLHLVFGYFAFWWFLSKPISLYGCFLLAFFLFQCGQYVLYGFNAEYNYVYVEHYSKETVIKSVLFSIMCNGAALLGGFYCTYHRPNRFVERINKVNNHLVYKVAKKILVVLSAIEFPYLLIRLTVVLKSGYHGVIALEESLPSVLSLIDMLFVPACVLSIIYCDTKRKKLFAYMIVIWAVITALNGDRSSGIGGLVIFALLYLNGVLKKKSSKKINVLTYVGFAIIGLMCLYLVMFVYKFRTQADDLSFFSNVLSIIVDVVGELGFSFFPLVLTMMICPSSEGYLYGKTLIASFVASIYPASLDSTGFIKNMYSVSKTGQQWLEQYYTYTFGLGYSLNAEAYSNFGYMGWLWIFVLCTIVAKVLAEPDFSANDNKFSQYSALALLYIWFTMPRRSCYYIVNFYVWYVIVIGLLILVFYRWRK